MFYGRVVRFSSCFALGHTLFAVVDGVGWGFRCFSSSFGGWGLTAGVGGLSRNTGFLLGVEHHVFLASTSM